MTKLGDHFDWHFIPESVSNIDRQRIEAMQRRGDNTGADKLLPRCRQEHREEQRLLQRSLGIANGKGRTETTQEDPSSYVDRLKQRLHTGAAVCDLPTPCPLVEGLLFMPGVSFVYGPPKVGKSFFSLDLALSVATGRPFMGHDTIPNRVLYVVAEGVGGIGDHVSAWCQHRRVEPAELNRASSLTTAVNLSVTMDVAALEAILAELNPALVVLDTLARCTVGVEENSAKDMGQVVAALDRLRDVTEGHICTVHHAGKDATKGLRGTTALRGAADTVISLMGDAQAIEVKVEDQKDAEAAKPWWCRLTPVGRSVVIEPVDGVDRLAPSIALTLMVLDGLPAEDRTSSKWEAVAEAAGISRRSFYQARKSYSLAVTCKEEDKAAPSTSSTRVETKSHEGADRGRCRSAGTN